MDWCYPNANYFRNCFATHWLPDVIITDNRWCSLNCTKNKKWLPCGFFIGSKSYAFLQPLGCYKKTEHTIQFLFGHFVSFQEQYMMTSDSMIIQTSKNLKNWYGYTQTKRLFSTDHCLLTAPVFELGVVEWKMMTS